MNLYYVSNRNNTYTLIWSKTMSSLETSLIQRMECNKRNASFIYFILLLVWIFLIHYTSSSLASVFCVRYTWFCMTWWNEVKQCNLSEIKEDRIETIHLLYFGYFYTEEKNDQIRLLWVLCYSCNIMKIVVKYKFNFNILQYFYIQHIK